MSQTIIVLFILVSPVIIRLRTLEDFIGTMTTSNRLLLLPGGIELQSIHILIISG